MSGRTVGVTSRTKPHSKRDIGLHVTARTSGDKCNVHKSLYNVGENGIMFLVDVKLYTNLAGTENIRPNAIGVV